MTTENPAPPPLEIRAFTPEDRAAGHDMRVMAFSSKMAVEYDPASPYIPDHRRFGAFADDGTLVSQAGAWPMGQWFLGGRVPMAGIGGVTTAPEHRGRGTARDVLHTLVQQCIEQGDALSALYPSVPGFYRSMGWEQGGVLVDRRVRTEALRALPQPTADVRVRPIVCGTPQERSADEVGVMQVIDHVNRRAHGALDRGADFHARNLDPDDDLVQFVAEVDGTITGCLTLEKEVPQPEDGHVSFRLTVGDLYATDHDTWLALWRSVGSHAPVSAVAKFDSQPYEPLLDLLPTNAIVPQTVIHHWQARVLDAPAAVASRGWPVGIDLEVHLRLHDAWLPDNAGNWVLRIADGHGVLDAGGDGTVALDIGTFSSVFTGHLGPVDAAWQRRVEGATGGDIDALTEAFRSPQPHLDAYF